MAETPRPDDGAPTASAPPATGSPDAQEAAEREQQWQVTGLSCPNCGGALEVATGLRVAHCPFCETPLLALGELGIERFAVAPRIDAAAAKDATRRWWGSGYNKDPQLVRGAELGEAFLCFLPFFRSQADAIGYALGTVKRQRTEGSGKNRRTVTYEEPVERRIERHFDRTWPAVHVGEWGVRKIDLTGDALVPFDGEALAHRGMVFSPTVSEREVRDAALASFREEADPTGGFTRTSFRYLETVREHFTVIHYPLWVVRYRHRERSYQAVIDAEGGQLAYGKAPGNDLYRALMLVGTEAAACFLVTTVLQYFSDDGCAPLIGAGAVALALLRWGWKRFRYGAVVEEGTGTEADGLFDTMPTTLKTLIEEGRSALQKTGRVGSS